MRIENERRISDMAFVFLSSSVTPGVTISQLITSGYTKLFRNEKTMMMKVHTSIALRT
jgi:hypothetical protein